jgi:hypothetical protein
MDIEAFKLERISERRKYFLASYIRRSVLSKSYLILFRI